MRERIICHDDLYNITEYFIPHEDGEGFTQRTEFYPEAVIEENKLDLNMAGNHARWGDGKLVARIPLPIYYDWLAKGYIRDKRKLRALLNDSDNRFMRCWPGQI